MKKIFCHKCGKQIKSSKDLATGFHWVFVKPYHVRCYEFYSPLEIRPFKHGFRGRYELNGGVATFLSPFSGLAGLVFFGLGIFALLSEPLSILSWLSVIFGILLLGLPFARLYSYFKYERWLK